ncbi:MAG: hypothetical protein HDR04_07640 [Lachnospiraceae bacterium]|nr:hypothetical protein [Lachnospiraceae bacterium]
MKNVKKLLKKAMVFTLAASMLVGTPLTASAAGIRGVYSVSDGNGTIEGTENGSGTGTVTNTNTETGSGVLNNNDAKIIGIVLDKDTVKAEAGESETLTATIITDGDVSEADLDKLKSKIHWELSNADDVEGEPSKRNPAAYVGISTPNGAGDRTLLKLNPKKGTKAGQEVVVTAKIDNTYYFDENNELKEYVTKREPYTASATVSVKEYSKDFEFFDLPEKGKIYVKHTINMNDHVQRIPETANDEITWISTNTKAATVTAAGVVTFKKAGESGKIIAVGEREAYKEWDYGTIEAGTPASKVVIQDGDGAAFDKKKASYDIKDDIDNWGQDVQVELYAKVKAAVDDKGELVTDPEYLVKTLDKDGNVKSIKSKTVELVEGTPYIEVSKDNKTYKVWDKLVVTDTITWLSNKPAIVSVESTEGYDNKLYAKGAGTAVITAKASSGKSDKLTVTVKAILSEIWIAEDADGTPLVNDPGLYSGQTMQLYVGRNPKANKDAVKWSIEKVKNDKGKDVANPNATINAKGLLTIKPKVESGAEVVVVLEPKKAVAGVEPAKFSFVVTQSSIDGITVTEEGYDAPIAKVSLNDKGKVVQNNGVDKSANTREIAIPKNKTYIAEPIPSVDDYDSAADSLTWKSSNTKVAELSTDIGGNVKITAKATGTSTITVSGIRVNGTKASVIKTTFKVSVKQPVKTITLNKTSVVLNKKTKKVKGETVTADQKVALKATLGPKGVKKTDVHWSVTKNGNPLTSDEELEALGLLKKSKEVVAASVSVNLPQPEIGDVFEITAKTDSGASATATVKVVNTTTEVQIRKIVGDSEEVVSKNEALNIGYSIALKTYINTAAKKDPATWQLEGFDNLDSTNRDVRETVEYSVNKKGIVTIDTKTGTIRAINSGKVTITAKTPLNKKASFTITVSKPQ